MLNGELFGEPAWDMLLALYCLPARGEIMAVTSLSYAADVPLTTGHRWQETLVKEGLIERGPESERGYRHLVRLTTKGRTLLENYLTRLFYVSTPVPPHPDLAGG
jgi:predicted transcriptional regulator